ncbi:hypothetical protein PR048_008903 [Dryococelus australis]|uniref:Uncharacterized protein n=1 Tax=Dryococelus australis TaxID=614101 RepID=A0ABQ9HZB1_9NEOP|nr:hypothetical protein PR048_008903 [Dryococelus australis]
MACPDNKKRSEKEEGGGCCREGVDKMACSCVGVSRQPWRKARNAPEKLDNSSVRKRVRKIRERERALSLAYQNQLTAQNVCTNAQLNSMRISEISYSRQKDMLRQLVNSSPVERKHKRTNTGHQRVRSKCYFFLKDQEIVRVISHCPVDTAMCKASQIGNFMEEDRRGKKVSPNKTPLDALLKIKDHIESHYCRKTTKRDYLDSKLYISKMYKLFKKESIEQNVYFVPSVGVYRHDQCLICTNYERATGGEKEHLTIEFREHQKRKDEAMAMRGSNDSTFMSATFNLKSVLQIPCSEVSHIYYSRNCQQSI